VSAANISVAVTTPLSVLIGLSRERLYMAGALTRLLRNFTRTPAADPQALMASALDPSLRIAYPPPNLHGYVALDGTPRTPTAHEPGRAVTIVEDGQRTVAAVSYSSELRDQGRFIQAAASVALMRLESAQLKADLRASTADLYASRVRLVEAAHGFDASATANGTGIANMRDGVEAIGGTLRVDSAPARALASGAARGRRSPPRARSANDRGTRDPWP
jgi:hypothetical protein